MSVPVIAGVGQTAIGFVPDATANDLYAEGSLGAITDAGLAPRDVDGVITANSRVSPYQNHAESLAEDLGIGHRFTLTIQTGGASLLRALAIAGRLVASGDVGAILVAAADNLLSGWTRRAAVQSLAETGYRDYEAPYGVFAPALFALTATRHMEEHGTTPDQLAAVAVTMRANASTTTRAHLRDPISIDDVLSSPMISSPLHRLDCAPISDGGAAIVVTGSDRLPPGSPRIAISGYGEAHEPSLPYATDVLRRPALQEAAAHALEASGASLSDVDLLMIYDPFTIEVLVSLEAIGVCHPGRAAALVSEGYIASHGTLPVNTHGGLLSYGHPGRSGALFHVVEAVHQLRGSADPLERQVPDVTMALLTSEGAMLSTYAAAVLARVG